MNAAATGDATRDALRRLLAESVRMWGVPARVSLAEDGAIVVTTLGAEVVVARAAARLPFRWTVSVREGEGQPRQRPALSVVSVLRQVRLALDPRPLAVNTGRTSEQLSIGNPRPGH